MALAQAEVSFEARIEQGATHFNGPAQQRLAKTLKARGPGHKAAGHSGHANIYAGGKRRTRYEVRFCWKGVAQYIGRFDNLEEAITARDEALAQRHARR